jgi:hypothetical protein
MALYYAVGKRAPHTGTPLGMMVQIVKGELRKIGHWTTYATAPLNELIPADKDLVGWYWYNTNKENRYRLEDETALALQGHKAELFDQLKRIYNEDIEFFEFISEKLDRVWLWGFEEEIKRRETIAAHTPHDVKYVIYNTETNHNGWRINVGEPLGVATVRTTGDTDADAATAIKRTLGRLQNKPENEVRAVGFYNALPYHTYADKRDEHINGLRTQLDEALKAAVWDNN